jgi:hypothetical protein
MQAKTVVSVIIEGAKKVLLLQTRGNFYKLLTANVESFESPIYTARRILKDQGIDKVDMKHLIGIYSLSDIENDKNILVFAFAAHANGEEGELKSFAKGELEKLVEEEKQLEDASISAVILRDYLQGERYPLEILKRVEEVKL